VSTPISWSPDGKRLAFLPTQVTPALSSQLIVAEADGGQERALAVRDPSAVWVSLFAPWHPSFPPAWSPDGRMIAIAAVRVPDARVVFVDSQTGSHQEMPSLSGAPNGLSWLDAQSLVLNTLPQVGGQNQLFRLPYPAGQITRITNDPNDYVGASLSGDRRDLVTSRRDARMDVWSGDGGTGSTLAQRVPVSIERIAWAGDRILYGGFVGGRPTILQVTPGKASSEEIVRDALSPGATSDGRTIVFVSSAAGALDLWTANASGRRIAQLVPRVTASQIVVTPDDRAVLYTSLAGGAIPIWTVPLAGGTPTKLVDGGAAAVSPDGRTLAFVAMGRPQASLSVCALPGCTSPRAIGSARSDAAVAWTPDGGGVAFAREGNLWVQALEGGEPRQLTRFTDIRPIASFAWSRDGKRLAVTRSTVTNDIVHFKGLGRE
jgi:Tol biopolymer transport system component